MSRHWIENHRKQYNAYQKVYQKRYYKRFKNKCLLSGKKWRRKNKYYIKLRDRSKWLIKVGKVLKEPCAICKSMKDLIAIAQDPNDPRIILFLCKKHWLEHKKTIKQTR